MCQSQPYFPGTTKQVQYREAIWVGYRYFDTTNTKTLFPFGHGLSYTNFTYYHLTLLSGDKSPFDESASIKLQITITNTGNRAGAEVVQCYVGQKSPSQPRPAKELKAFEKVFLEPGESKEVVFELDYRAFAYWHKNKATWVAESGEYQIHIGSSVEDIRDTASIALDTGITAEQPNSALATYFTPAKRDFNDAAFSALLGYDIPTPTPITPYTVNSTLGDIANEPLGKPLFDSMLSVFTKMMGET
ncbi:fibronectin type III-like domain-contianing protein [Marinomonas rhodophyticola]|uniref:Fibronectin type III-like domain-contianing protein n=1 Tax=Marinomonas rhodophyticola TaxID=2992803 RepID=A0ABT3KIU6_9GAMM|nr:fibronectin type III-like domain-contianing protein [Marinomonas sp. KJ51-3]MCW4630457.1 fibronectin type III-like domain-contianing protein [Marinomonas sp. KJ51-3]